MILHARIRYSKADIRPRARASEFSATTHKELVAEISSRLSFPFNLEPSEFMESYAERVLVWREQRVRTSTAEEFLADLVKVGALHLWSDTGDTDDQPLS